MPEDSVSMAIERSNFGVNSFRQSSPPEFWQSLDEIPAARTISQPAIQPSRFQALTLDATALQAALAHAPQELAVEEARSVPLEIPLPMPDGTLSWFQVAESPIMAPELAAKFPNIKTYKGQGIDDPAASVRFDLTPAGFHAQIRSPSGTYYIDPYSPGDDSIYISYFQRDYLTRPDFIFYEDPQEENANLPETLVWSRDDATHTAELGLSAEAGMRSAGGELRTYQLAVAATGEYTQFHGGTVELGQAAIVTAINRVTGIYENELAIRLQLVANNDALVYTNPATDPYTNNNASLLLSQNQTNIDGVIGNANYDIGHVFSTAGGGLASRGVVGLSGWKARGETGLSNPVGDPFFVDYVAHEIGHQFNARHTFNGCGNGTLGNGYEPGSGSTIMGYAGICGNDNLQLNSDPYFHAASFEEIQAFVTSGFANTAATITPTGNTIPTVSAGLDYTIPAATPFTLTATGFDGDGDVLTYTWEEYDLGSAQPVSAPDNGSSPLFRSFLPTIDPTRTFPRLSDLLNQTTPIGETLPTTDRTLNFRVTVRDHRSGGGGVNSDNMLITVVNTGSPFQVTSHNSADTHLGNTIETLTWDVAGTADGLINVDMVNILLSTDGGLTYPMVLATNTPNDGVQPIVFPNLDTTEARIKIEAIGNIFFDMTDTDLAIAAVPAATLGDDSLVGTLADDHLEALAGRDTVRGGEGNDQLLGQDGDDQLHGGLGHDSLNGGSGNDVLNGGSENDTLNGLIDHDTLDGEAGNDHLLGGVGNDVLWGGDDPDTLLGEGGSDSLSGNLGNDQLDGGFEDDFLYGGSEDDTLLGQDGNDELWGDAGIDRLLGGDGADTLIGTNATLAGIGERDLLRGQGDGDRFVLGSDTQAYYLGAGITDYARILDFTLGEDTLQLYSGISYQLLEMNGNTQIRASGDLMGLIVGVTGLTLNDTTVFVYV